MNELFEMVLILSLFGLALTVLLLCIKPFTIKKFPAKWQYVVWVLVMLSMIVPVYKFIPKQEAEKITYIVTNEYEQPKINPQTGTVYVEIPAEEPIKETVSQMTLQKAEILIFIWLLGMGMFLLIASTSYGIYLFKKKKSSVVLESKIFEDVKKELKIKKNIRLKMSKDVKSPMLVGVFFPTVYIPAKSICDENMRMVFLHELTHYKRKDLIIKWLSLFVNAVHWFNPFTYILCANLSEACEISCDMAVTSKMSEEERKTYMKTIINFVEEGK